MGNEPKLPVKQLTVLAIARFAEPVALTSILPYLPEMVKSFGVEKEQVAKWAGIIVSTFSISQSVFAVLWGRASDHFGRKPIILLGLFSTMCCFLAWGLVSSLSTAIVVRAVMGGSNGNVGIIRTMVAEMVPSKELQPKAASIMPLVWSIGSVFGPAFGGLFASPVEQYPWLFGGSTFLKQHPFALPNFIACAIFFVSMVTGLLFLEETLESKRHQRDWDLKLGEKLIRPFRRKTKKTQRACLPLVNDQTRAPLLAPNTSLTYGATSGTSADTQAVSPTPKPPSVASIFTKQVVIILISYTFLALHAISYDQLLPVFLNYPRRRHTSSNTHLPIYFSGGFGLSSDKIGTIYTVCGIACSLAQFLLFPPLCARFGVLNCFKASTAVFPLIYALTPFIVLIEPCRPRFAALAVLMFAKGLALMVGFPCTTILLTNSAPSLHAFGTLNGFATTFSGLGRAAGPALTGLVFSWGVKRDLMIAPWWMLAMVAGLAAVPGCFIVEKDGDREAEGSD